MEDITTTAENTEQSLNTDDISGALSSILKVFEFLKSIVDMLAGLIQPLFVDIFKGILNK